MVKKKNLAKFFVLFLSSILGIDSAQNLAKTDAKGGYVCSYN